MIECKHCGHTSNEGEFNFCPICGKNLSTSLDDKKVKKEKKVKKQKITICDLGKRKVRGSYVFFGIFALLLSLASCWLYGDLFLRETIGVGWANNFADKFEKWVSFGGIREKTLEKLPFLDSYIFGEFDGYVEVTKTFSFMFIFVALVFLLNLFSLFTGKQNTGSVFYKLSEFATTLIILVSFVKNYLSNIDKAPKIIEFYNENRWLFWSVCGGVGVFAFIVGIFTSFSSKRAYKTTFYQFWKALFWLVIAGFNIVVILTIEDKVNISMDITNKILEWLPKVLCALPIYILLCSLFMFASSRHSKKSSQLMK